MFDILRENILGRGFRPGDRLDVRALADQLGVSATPVKDAMTRLAAEGLVEIRRALECLAAEHAVSRLTPDLLSRFTAIVDALERPVSTERERAQHDQKNVELHTLLVETSGNRRLTDLYRSLNAHLVVARVHSRRSPEESRLDQERREHRAILEALDARDATALVAALDRHIRRAGAALVDDVREAGVGAA